MEVQYIECMNSEKFEIWGSQGGEYELHALCNNMGAKHQHLKRIYAYHNVFCFSGTLFVPTNI
jgi:hypothetical protein